MKVELWAINHKQGTGVYGGISKEFRVDTGLCANYDPRHMDMGAPLYLYETRKVAPIIGFQGYRKFMNFRDPFVKGSGMCATWEEAPLGRFLEYQHWLTTYDPKELAYQLQKCDVITVDPFNCSYNGDIGEDYMKSRSWSDWSEFHRQMKAQGYREPLFRTSLIRPMHFVMRDYTFYRFMRDWKDVMIPLEDKVKSMDARDPEYCRRSLAFLSERFWSLWLDANPHLRVKTVPLMICWDAK